MAVVKVVERGGDGKVAEFMIAEAERKDGAKVTAKGKSKWILDLELAAK